MAKYIELFSLWAASIDRCVSLDLQHPIIVPKARYQEMAADHYCSLAIQSTVETPFANLR